MTRDLRVPAGVFLAEFHRRAPRTVHHLTPFVI